MTVHIGEMTTTVETITSAQPLGPETGKESMAAREIARRAAERAARIAARTRAEGFDD